MSNVENNNPVQDLHLTTLQQKDNPEASRQSMLIEEKSDSIRNRSAEVLFAWYTYCIQETESSIMGRLQ